MGVVPCFRGQLDFISATYVVLAWLGMLIFSIMGGVGLVVMPFDYLTKFIFRPKPLTVEDFKIRTKILLPRIMKLRS